MRKVFDARHLDDDNDFSPVSMTKDPAYYFKSRRCRNNVMSTILRGVGNRWSAGILIIDHVPPHLLLLYENRGK